MKKRIISIALILVVLVLGGLLAGKALMGNKVNVSWYSDDKTEFIIETADQLYELVEISEKRDLTGKTFKLGADIVVNEGNAEDWAKNAPERKWYPIRNFAGTFDGQGHTISGLYGSVYDKAMGLFTDTKSTAVLKDFKLVNTYFKAIGSPGTAAIAGGTKNSGKFDRIYADANIDCDGIYTAGIASYATGGDMTITECWFNGTIQRYYYNHTGGGLVAQVNAATLTIEHCLFSGTIVNDEVKSYARVGGFCGVVGGSGKLNIKDCLSTGKIESPTTNQVGSAVGFVGTTSVTKLDTVFATVSCFGSGIGNGDDRTDGGVIRFEDKNLIGYNAYKWTNLDFEKYWAVVEESTPVLGYFTTEKLSTDGVEKMYDTSWFTGDTDEYEITTKEQLYGFALLSSTYDFEGVTIKLGADIALNEGDASKWTAETEADLWIPILNFGGTFNGQMHTISGIYLNGSGAMGLFHKTQMDSVVKNFYIKNSYFNNTSTASAYMGSVVGIGGGEFNTIYSDAIMTSTGFGVGGIAGYLSIGTPKIINCWYDGKITMLMDNGYSAGGIVGFAVAAGNIEHCLNSGSITAERKDNWVRLGGILGVAGSDSMMEIKDSLNVGTVEGFNKQVGSVLGFVGSNASVALDTICTTSESYAVAVGQASGALTGLPIQYNKADLIGYGGYQWTNLDFTNYWAAVKNGTPILKSFATSSLSTKGVAKKFDISWYNADKKSYTISDAADLYGVSILAGAGVTFEGKTIKLGADITANAGDAATWGTNPPTDSWIPITSFLGTFDGQMYTISGLYKNSGTNVGLFASTGESTVVKNLILENSYFANKTATGNVYIGGVAGKGGGKFDTIYSDVIIETTGVGAAGIIACVNEEKASIKNCWFAGEIKLLGQDAHSAAGMAAIVQKNMTLESCLNSGNLSAERADKYTRTAGIIGVIGSEAVVKIKDSLNVGAIDGYKEQTASLIGYIGSKATATLDADVYVTSESYTKAIGRTGGKLNGSVNSVSESSIKSSKAKTNASGLDFDKYWMTLSKRTPILKSFASKAPALASNGMTADTSWYTGTSKEYVLTKPEQLYGLEELSYDTDFAGVTIKLGADITVNTGDASKWGSAAPQYVWYPIQSFAGTFDGQGHTISGLYNVDGKNTGLFGETTEKSVVKNLRIENSYFANKTATGTVNVGGVAGKGGGTFDTIYADTIIETTGNTIGGITASVNTVSDKNIIRNCWFAGKLILSGKNAHTAGGIVGEVGVASSSKPVVPGSLKIENCLVDNGSDETQISSTGRTGSSNYLRIGGICGIASKAGSSIEITDSVVLGRITTDGTVHVGSVAGYITADPKANVSGVYATTESYSKVFGKASVSGVITASEEKYVGKGAFSVANTLDYKTVWAAIEGKTPILRSFLGGAVELEPSTYNTSWYDEEATNFTITTVEQLYALAELSKEHNFAGQTFELGNDITVNTLPTGKTAEYWKNSANAPENVWTPIGTTENPFAGTFDGKGFAIIGLYKDGGSNIGLFAYTATTAVVKDLRLVDTYFGGAEFVGAIVGQGGGTFDTIYTDAYLLTTNQYSGGIIARVNLPITDASKEANLVTNCWFNGTIDNTKTKYADSTGAEAGGIVGRLMDKATMTVEHCLVSGTIKSAISDKNLRMGGICGCIATEGSKLTVKDNLVISNFDVKVTTQIGTIAGFVTKTTVEYSDDVYALKSGSLKLIGQNSNGTVTGSTEYAHEITEISLLKDQAAYTNAEGLFETNTWWMAVKDSTPVLRSFKGDSVEVDKPTTPPPTPPVIPAGPIEITEYEANKTATEFVINNADQLYEFAELSKAYNFDGQIIYLGADITVNTLPKGKDASYWADTANAPDRVWTTPIGTADYPFCGTFDGKDPETDEIHIISGLYANGVSTHFGLFGRITEGSVIQNLRLVNTYFGVHRSGTSAGNLFAGSIAGSGNGTIKNVYSNAIVASNHGNGLGGIIGAMNAFGLENEIKLTVENCWFDGEVQMLGKGYAGGGIIGIDNKTNATINITNCLNSGTISSAGLGTYDRIGGICGQISQTGTKTYITDCLNVGTITSQKATNSVYGSIIGIIGANADITFTDVYAMTEASDKYYGANSSGKTVTKVFVAEADLKGDAAKTNASGLDFTNAWLAQDGKTPILKAFATETPVQQASLMSLFSRAVAVVASLFN